MTGARYTDVLFAFFAVGFLMVLGVTVVFNFSIILIVVEGEIVVVGTDVSYSLSFTAYASTEKIKKKVKFSLDTYC